MAPRVDVAFGAHIVVTFVLKSDFASIGLQRNQIRLPGSLHPPSPKSGLKS